MVRRVFLLKLPNVLPGVSFKLPLAQRATEVVVDIVMGNADVRLVGVDLSFANRVSMHGIPHGLK